MADSTQCTFCLQLPTLDMARPGRVTHCPLCKSELLKTNAVTYLIAGSVPRAQRLVPALLACAAAALLAGGWWLTLRSMSPRAVSAPRPSAVAKAGEPEKMSW